MSLPANEGTMEDSSIPTPPSGVLSKDQSLDFTNCLKFVRLPKQIQQDDGAFEPHDINAYRSAPLFTGQVHGAVTQAVSSSHSIYPQYALLGILPDDPTPVSEKHGDNLVFSNTSEPWSAFICGSQGSGKSHTLSCLLENALLAKSPVGIMKTPAAGMVFHYDKFSNFMNGQVCEAAYLCSSGIPVKVLVPRTSLRKMEKQYATLPGLPVGAARPKVVPLYFKQEQLSVDIMMILMAVEDTGVGAPLYISTIRHILREMAIDREDTPGFDYEAFINRLRRSSLTDGAIAPLNLRLELLRSVLLGSNESSENMDLYDHVWDPAPGTLTIVDLSDQFINESDACALFSICLKLFMGGWQSGPRIIALDEAHKFLTASTEANMLTSDLISVIRQQRHLSSRVLIATQEPTVSGELLDLCNVSIVHRFNSPQWYTTIKQHLAGAHRSSHEGDSDATFREIIKLPTGQALVFCPTATLFKDAESGRPTLLHDSYFKLDVRTRISTDGGQSVLPSQHFATKDLPAQKNFKTSKVSGIVAGNLKVASKKGKKSAPAALLNSVPARHW